MTLYHYPPQHFPPFPGSSHSSPHHETRTQTTEGPYQLLLLLFHSWATRVCCHSKLVNHLLTIYRYEIEASKGVPPQVACVYGLKSAGVPMDDIYLFYARNWCCDSVAEFKQMYKSCPPTHITCKNDIEMTSLRFVALCLLRLTLYQ